MRVGAFARLAGLAAICAVAGGCAVADTGAFVRLQEDMEVLKKQMASARGAAPAPPALPGAGGGGEENSSLRRSLADFAADNDRVKADLLALSSRTDESKIELQKEMSRLRGVVSEQGQSVTELKGKGAEVERRLSALEEKTEKLAAVKPAAPPEPSPQELSTPEEMYDYALGLIKRGETRKAREVLNAFAGKYPGHRLMQNVYYWKGETFYSEKDYESAILSFQDVVDRYPGGDKAPDAMLKQGLAFQSLNDRKNAKIVYELLQTKHPRSQAAGKAREKLLELK
ncbi:MAG TPA: tol-pal system protein YbgF [Deltaproteobacteria bacterium]|nr:MAG: tol-pal system protein YbgF [Deltaproteobacteria bacterium GWC2_65_14]HBO69473.1 tol-pal system protein YbgF [Deltaproteobacteria bacterium]